MILMLYRPPQKKINQIYFITLIVEQKGRGWCLLWKKCRPKGAITCILNITKANAVYHHQRAQMNFCSHCFSEVLGQDSVSKNCKVTLVTNILSWKILGTPAEGICALDCMHQHVKLQIAREGTSTSVASAGYQGPWGTRQHKSLPSASYAICAVVRCHLPFKRNLTV